MEATWRADPISGALLTSKECRATYSHHFYNQHLTAFHESDGVAETQNLYHSTAGFNVSVRPTNASMAEGRAKRLKLERGLVPVFVQRADKIPGSTQLPMRVMAHPQDSILRLKELISEAFDAEFGVSMKLLYKGKPLRDERSVVEQTLSDYGIRGNSRLLLKEAPWLSINEPRLKFADATTRSQQGRGHTGAAVLVRSTQALICSDTS